MKVDVEIGKKKFFWQTAYLIKILKCFQMSDCQFVSISINLRVANSLLSSESQDDKLIIKWYLSAIGSLM